MEYSVAQQSNQGGRDYNEDRTAVYERNDAILLVVADGLGGHAGGDLASQAFVDALGASFAKATSEQLADADSFLTLSINYAHHMIHRRAVAQGYDPESPKTTCVVCLVYQGVAQWAHSGDSRLYLIRKRMIVSQTDDHVSNKMGAAGNSPINRCVGGIEAPKPAISQRHQLDVGDIFVLASDGAWHCFEPIDLKDYVDPEHPTLGLDNLLQTLENRNKAPSDNLSMVILFWGIKQHDKPTVNELRNNDKIQLLGSRKQDDDKQINTADFDMDELDSTIIEIESFITDLDDQI
ncbi:MAG: PP2C family serine/threonine-protein phosphatase [Pseudomonadota bacterium]